MFNDRSEAAAKLALLLQNYNMHDPLVLGRANGSVELVYALAIQLHAEPSVILVNELSYPEIPQTVFGAVTEGGAQYISLATQRHLAQDQLEKLVDDAKVDLQLHIQHLRHDTYFPTIAGRTVIITDEGTASGAAILALVNVCQQHQASQIIVALPIGNPRMEQILRAKADDVIILDEPHFYTSIRDTYENYNAIGDKEAFDLLNKHHDEDKLQHV
jgi:putative phosphoribosyl transferase